MLSVANCPEKIFRPSKCAQRKTIWSPGSLGKPHSLVFGLVLILSGCPYEKNTFTICSLQYRTKSKTFVRAQINTPSLSM